MGGGKMTDGASNSEICVFVLQWTSVIVCVCECSYEPQSFNKRQWVGKLHINLSESKADWLGETKTQRHSWGSILSVNQLMPDLYSSAMKEFSPTAWSPIICSSGGSRKIYIGWQKGWHEVLAGWQVVKGWMWVNAAVHICRSAIAAKFLFPFFN